jgi:iron complex transport system substrate-binding protein
MSRRLGRTAIRSFLSLLMTLGLLGALTACGSSASTSAGSGASASSAAFHASIKGKFGTTTLSSKPVRVVALSWTDADFALALGVTPVGVTKVSTATGGIQPWTKTALGSSSPTVLDTTDGDPIEAIAALRPDVILATKDYNLSTSYADLSKIAPVVTYVSGPNNDSWQQDFANVATALGDSAKATTVTSATEATIAKTKSTYSELSGKTFSYIVAPSASGAYTVNSTTDVSAQLLGELGMQLSPADLKLPSSSTPGRAQISLENLDELNADVVIAASDSAGLSMLSSNAVFKKMAAVERGSYVPLDYTAATALAFPSPLSLDWAMTNVVPKLAAAAAKG